ncbi:uncharacterized protein QC761_101120 [Podospora bellae-mahoneyi]|uniref:Transporter n=1 Tax=Podospora bellae-mahoneyi TaxID=2093777 RepID=A0ABR0FTZ6_9PEZI|nr:hypothetical protein QC761_101120 [Podospora bellae-mahoneyi]
MSLAISQCVYSQIQRYSLRRQKPRGLEEQVAIFVATRIFDVGLTTAAAVAAAAAGANAMGVPLTSDILRHAAIGGAIKAAAMAVAGLIMLAPQNTPLIVLMTLLGTSIGSNALAVVAVANRIFGTDQAPNQLIIAAVVASIPLSFCFVYYYGAFRVPITFTSIAFDVLGAYTFVRMAENLGHPICPPRPALVAGAVFGAVFSGAITLLGCCVIGKSRTIPISDFSGNGHVSGSALTTCCGNRVHVNVQSTEYARGQGVVGSRNTFTNGTIYNSAHGIGVYWDPGSIHGGLTFNTHSTRDCTTSTGTSNMTRIVMA